MIWIEHKGEELLVSSLDGYPDAVVLGEDIPPQPSDFHYLFMGVWVEDDAERDAVTEERRLQNLSRTELAAEIEAKVEARWANEMAKRDVQIAELAGATQFRITALADINLDEPLD